MRIMSQTKAAKLAKVHQSEIGRALKLGKLKRYNKSDVDLDEVITLFPREAKEQAEYTAPTTPTTAQPQQQQQPKLKMNYADARTHREAFNAKLAEVTYKERVGQLLTVAEVKEVIDKIVTPFNRHYDEQPILLKSTFPDIDDEIIKWITNHNNKNKMDFQELI